jgi:hypothetical protein
MIEHETILREAIATLRDASHPQLAQKAERALAELLADLRELRSSVANQEYRLKNLTAARDEARRAMNGATRNCGCDYTPPA